MNSLAPNEEDLPFIIVEDILEDMGEQPTTSERTASPDRKRLRKVQPKASNVALPPGNKETIFEWIKNDSSSLVNIFPVANYEDCRDLLPHQQFEKFFDDVILTHICEQSAIYATEHNRPNPNLSVGELRAFIGILIITGFNYHSNFRNLWSQDEVIRNNLVCSTMRRNRFQEILQCLHFEDNSKAPSKEGANIDKMWKLRPLTDHLKAKMIEHFHVEQNLSFDESMIAYFGRHGCKQFIKGKPLRFGYKVWSLCTPSGYLVNFEIYQGKNPRSNAEYEAKFGKCAAPLINMIDDFSDELKSLPFSFYFDNLFTSYPLLAYLKSCGYNATGTIRENRIPASCPLAHKKTFKPMERGYSESIEMKGTGIRLVKWKDNSVVCMLSTCFGESPKSMAQRYSKERGAKINVPRPLAITEYNKYMCGVDRLDQNLAQYRIAYRGKKWWSSIFTWLIDACIQNAWQLYRKGQPTMTQLEFRKQLAVYYCKYYGTQAKTSGPMTSHRYAQQPGRVEHTLRYDQIGHFVVPSNRRHCAGDQCKVNGRTACVKCNVGLCVKCFANYHTKP